MTTLREAAQAVVDCDDGGSYMARTQSARLAIDALRVALAAEPTQEPVAWMWQHDETGRFGFLEAGADLKHWAEHNPQLNIICPLYAHPAPPQTPMTDAERVRGYANLGIGAYRINHSAAGNDAELVITLATATDIATRTVGDMLDNESDGQIDAKDMVIRIRFANEAGLAALENQLRMLREVHFTDDGDITNKAGLLPDDGWDDMPSTSHGIGPARGE
jgi:hypothetical protein